MSLEFEKYNFDTENPLSYICNLDCDNIPYISEDATSYISKTTNDELNEIFLKSNNNSILSNKNEILSARKIIKKESNFNIPYYVNLIKNDKERKKEIQKLKNRESAQISRDRKKKEFEEQKYKVKHLEDEIDQLKAENKVLREKLSSNKCESCGYSNVPEVDDEKTSRLNNSNNYNTLYSSMILLGIIGICCLSVPSFYKSNYPQNNVNMFAEIIDNPSIYFALNEKNKLTENSKNYNNFQNENSNSKNRWQQQFATLNYFANDRMCFNDIPPIQLKKNVYSLINYSTKLFLKRFFCNYCMLEGKITVKSLK